MAQVKVTLELDLELAFAVRDRFQELFVKADSRAVDQSKEESYRAFWSARATYWFDALTAVQAVMPRV